MWIYWRPRGSPFGVPLPWWLPLTGASPDSPLAAPGPIEVILAMVIIAVYCYIGLAWALCYIRLGIARAIGAIRNVVQLVELAEPA